MIWRTAVLNLSKSKEKLKIPMAKVMPVQEKHAVENAVSYLNSGEVIALPTDTIYGLACDATSSSAVDKLFEIKSRDINKPVAICVGNMSDISKWGNTNHIPSKLLEALLPGPVTLILPCRSTINQLLSYRGKVGIRIPNYDFIREVATTLNKPLALTSANISGKSSSVNIKDFYEIWDKLPAVFDGGQISFRNEGSTIIDLSIAGEYKILRSGVLEKTVHRLLKKFNLKQID